MSDRNQAQAGAATNALMAMSPEDKERHEAGMAGYRAHQRLEADRSARAAALDLAVRCAQPGSHADAVMGDARKFFEWLTDAT